MGAIPFCRCNLEGLFVAGVAEGAGMFLKHGTSRVTTSGALENVRMGLEAALLEGLVGSSQVVPELTQKRAVLCVMRPRDRLRLLSMVKPAWSVHDKARPYALQKRSLHILTVQGKQRACLD